MPVPLVHRPRRVRRRHRRMPPASPAPCRPRLPSSRRQLRRLKANRPPQPSREEPRHETPRRSAWSRPQQHRWLAAVGQDLLHRAAVRTGGAARLVLLRQQLDEMKDMLRQLLRQLPSKTEMPELLIDISQTALSAGLQVDSFVPQPEVPKDFYAEKPIQLKMVGTYHQFGTFISGVASLPRVVILTMHDVSLTP